MPAPRKPIISRLLDGLVDASGPCWLLTSYVGPQGYALLWADGRPLAAHRAVWEALVGPIPDGHQLDHLCRVRHCVNPDHLEPVTPKENSRRAAPSGGGGRAFWTECKHGHAFDEANTYRIPSTGARQCRTCMSARKRARRSNHA